MSDKRQVLRDGPSRWRDVGRDAHMNADHPVPTRRLFPSIEVVSSFNQACSTHLGNKILQNFQIFFQRA